MTAFAALAPLRAELAVSQETLSEELIDKVGDFVLAAIDTLALADEADAWLTTRLLALDAVRADELRRDPDDRDRDWMQDAKEARARAVQLLGSVRLTRAKLERAA